MAKAWSCLVSTLDFGMAITDVPEEKRLKGLRISKLIIKMTKQCKKNPVKSCCLLLQKQWTIRVVLTETDQPMKTLQLEIQREVWEICTLRLDLKNFKNIRDIREKCFPHWDEGQTADIQFPAFQYEYETFIQAMRASQPQTMSGVLLVRQIQTNVCSLL